MPEPRPIPLAPLGMSPEEVAARTFAVVRRGYDPDAVRRFLEEVAGLLRHARSAELDLHARLSDAEQRAASPVLDESVLSAALGAETARVLQVAHEAAQEVVAKAEERADALLEEASSVHATRAAAAESEAAATLERARRSAEDIVERTKTECRAMLEQAREARRRVLDDLAARRRDLHGQIEQLRAAKDALSGIFVDAASAVAEVQRRVAGSEDEAREAAGGVARRLHAEGATAPALDAVSLGLEPASDAAAEAAPADLAADLVAVDDGDLEVDLAAILPPFDGEAGADDEAADDEAAGDEGPGEEGLGEEPGGEGAPSVEVVAEGPPADGGGPPAEAPVATEAPIVTEAPVATGAPGGTGVSAPEGGEPPGGGEGPGETADARAPGGAGLGVSEQAEEADAANAPSAVDALFARIRASRAEEVAKAHVVLTEAPADEPRGGVAPPAGPPSEASAVEAAVVEAAEAAAGALADEPGAPDRAEAGRGSEADGAALAAQRDALVEPARVELGRALKRVLRSQQNELLDAARTLRAADAEELLAGEETVGRIAEAVEAAVAVAWGAGRELVGAPAGTEEAGRVAAGEIARELAGEVVEAIDDRLREEIASLETSGGPGGDEGLGELVGVAYRDWKGARIDAVAAEVALRAFAAGSVAGAAALGAKVRWVLESGQPCADCDDNALSEPLEPGQAFPTGQAQPPLHAGCRCVLAAVTG